MSFGWGNLALADWRQEGRDEVHYRAKAFGPDARPLNLLIVNISPHGLMARSEVEYAIGERVRVMLPMIGAVAAEIRWSLGGRLGCQFDQPIDLAAYYELIALMLKSK